MRKEQVAFQVVLLIALLPLACSSESKIGKGTEVGMKSRSNNGKAGSSNASNIEAAIGGNFDKGDEAFFRSEQGRSVGSSELDGQIRERASDAGRIASAIDGSIPSNGTEGGISTGGNEENGTDEDGGKDGATVGSIGDCSNVPCWTTPLCSVGCIFPCGCCPCTEGTTLNAYECKDGCWADNKSSPLTSGCYYEGPWGPQLLQPGEEFPARNFCSTCKCTEDNAVVCVEIACCDSAMNTTPRRFYLGDREKCSTVDLIECKKINASRFFDDCGCGCEQDPSCPESFDCRSTANQPCNFSDIFSRCPYSDILL